MAGHALETWHQQGLVSLWRYVGANRSYQGWHLSANADGCRSLIVLIDAFTDDAPALHRTVSLTAPSEALLRVPGPMSWRVESAPKLRMSRSTSPDDWFLSESVDAVSFALGATWRDKFRDAIDALSKGEGDFGIGPKDREKWIHFWWWRQ